MAIAAGEFYISFETDAGRKGIPSRSGQTEPAGWAALMGGGLGRLVASLLHGREAGAWGDVK
jgi:hypothetical protein